MVWIKALQFAIARKKPSQHSSSVSIDEASIKDDKNVYNEIDEASMRETRVCNVKMSDTQTPTTVNLTNYIEPYDRQSGERKCNGDYWEVDDVRNNLRQAATGSTYNTCEFSTAYATIDQFSVDRSESAVLPVCIDVYAQVNKAKKPTLLHRLSVSENGVLQIDGTLDANLISGSAVNSAVEKEASIEGNNFAKSENLQMRITETEDGKFCQVLVDALTDSGSPTCDLIRPLTDEDWKPIYELTEFLSNNREICQASHSCMSVNSDPVSTLKSYLATLDISVRQIDND
ncbi:hypothetical protein BsWGS_06517 [Bradybaena similaris]